MRTIHWKAWLAAAWAAVAVAGHAAPLPALVIDTSQRSIAEVVQALEEQIQSLRVAAGVTG